MQKYDVVIIGAGAAGLMCAAQTAKRGRKVLVIEHTAKIAAKIRISGGGRCNFTNLEISPHKYISQNPHFCVAALKRYTQFDFIELVKSYKIAYHEKTLGQLFCNDSAAQIIDMLLRECKTSGAQIITSTKVSSVEAGYNLHTTNGEFSCESLVIACGGLSIPTIGASSFGYDIARQFGLNIIPTQAALVPLTVDQFSDMAGVSVFAAAKIAKTSFEEGLLFTHKGLSGPAILQISSYWKLGDEVTINFAPNINVFEKLKELRTQNPRQELKTVIATFVPKKLAYYLCNDSNERIADLSNKRLQEVADNITELRVRPTGTEGYRVAEVTLGGVDTKELSSKTFEAQKAKGLYFIGEVLDVTGWLGGYNLQWAWSSGYCAGQVT